MRLTDLADGTIDALRSAGAYLSDFATPSIRLGVTGLARAGKTVFITALIRNLTHGGRLPFFDAYAEGRILRAYLQPQPDDDVPRFDYESHLAALLSDPPRWPESTRRISELRLTLEYQSKEPAEARGVDRPAPYRHRRLSRRVAARSRPARPELRRVVPRVDRACVCTSTVSRQRGVAAISCDARSGSTAGRAGCPGSSARVHRLSRRRARSRAGAFDAWPGALLAAGRSRRITAPDVRAPRYAGGLQSTARLVGGHDGAALRELQNARR